MGVEGTQARLVRGEAKQIPRTKFAIGVTDRSGYQQFAGASIRNIAAGYEARNHH
jgi:hypothetical protein